MASMDQAGLHLFDPADFDAASLRTATDMAEGLARTVTIARVLVEHGRTVDLSGLQHGVGLFCAKALDLPPGAGRSLRPLAVTLLAETDRLTEALRTQADA